MIWNDPIPRRAYEKGGSSSNAAGNAAQSSANTQSNALNQIQQLIAGMQGLTSGVSGEVGGSGSGSLMQLLGLGSSPTALAGFSGVNAPGVEASTIPALQSFYTGEMQNGGGPGFQQASTNAQSQLQQQFGQSLSSILSSTAPGQNPNAQIQAAQNQDLTASTNLAGNLAGQQQAIMQQGASGLGTTAEAAQGFNTTSLQNLLSSLSPILSLISGGNSSALSSLGGVNSTAASQGTSDLNLQNQENQQQNNAWGSIFSGLLGMGNNALTGGAASVANGGAAGSLGSILSGLSDERLKTNIEPVGPRVDGLQAYSFLWRHSGAADVGFLAQDVERTHPEFVSETREGIKYVDYGAASDRFIRELERSLRAAAV